MKTIRNYFEVTKPRIWLLLVFTAFGGLVAARGWSIPWLTASVALIAVTLGSAGSNTLTNYLDRDIDAVMDRTRLRPLPSRRISPASHALYFGLTLTALSLILAASINTLTFALMLLGVFDNVVVYSRLLKRRSPLNIVLGGFSGGVPVLIGYAAVENTLSTLALFMAALVMIWIPTHIWSLALYSRDDYAKANIPMLPVVVGERAAVRVIAAASTVMVVFSLAAPIFSQLGSVYIYPAAVLGAVMLVLSLWLFLRPTKEVSWIVFKFSSPYLGLIFLAMIVDALV